ncbi:MAG TPA: hypothetical protein VH643_23825 [Gemmataceae bacterium]|jgi:hypothetical protein
MNLLCPNCQKMLTVPEEFAGQLMKCPMCNGTFTVPELPGTGSPAPTPPSSAPGADIFSFRPDAPAAPPPSSFTPPPAPKPEPPPSTATTTTPPPSRSPLPTEDYQHSAAVWFSPKVLPWIAPACLLLVFVLSFFNWVGVYPGGVPAVTQNAWQAAFGLHSLDGDMEKKFGQFLKDDNSNYKPGVSVLTIFYLLLFFPTLFVTVASVAIGMVPLKLPPGVEKLLPWRWGIVAAANLILFLFLGLQLLLGFSLETRYAEWVDKQIDSKEVKTSEKQKEDAAERGEKMERLSRTVALRLTVILHLLATASAALLFWITQRGTHRPLPMIELRW